MLTDEYRKFLVFYCQLKITKSNGVLLWDIRFQEAYIHGNKCPALAPALAAIHSQGIFVQLPGSWTCIHKSHTMKQVMCTVEAVPGDSTDDFEPV